MVDVEHRPLGSLEQQPVTGLLCCKKIAADIAHHGGHRRGKRHGLIDDLLHRDGGSAQVLRQHEVVQIEHFLDFGTEPRGIEQILDAQRATRYLVFIRRPDAPTGRPDLGVATAGLAGLIQRDVVGQDQRARFGDLQARSHILPRRLQLRNFLEQCLRRQHDPVTDVADNARVHDPRWNQAKNGLLAIDPEGMARIVAALKAHDALGGLGEPVDDFALAFVTPLGTDHYNVLAHVTC